MPLAISFDSTIDAGAVLTVVTILGGILAWAFREWRTWRRSEEQRAKDGALRLLLAILRQSDRPMTFEELHSAFSAPEREREREEYCRRNFAFDNRTEFEAAVYRLDWEGKIDFLDANTIAFSVDHYVAERPVVIPLPMAPDRVVATLESALADSAGANTYELERIGRLAMKVAPSRATDVLRRHIEQVADDPAREREAVLLLEAASFNWAPPSPG